MHNIRIEWNEYDEFFKTILFYLFSIATAIGFFSVVVVVVIEVVVLRVVIVVAVVVVLFVVVSAKSWSWGESWSDGSNWVWLSSFVFRGDRKFFLFSAVLNRIYTLE